VTGTATVAEPTVETGQLVGLRRHLRAEVVPGEAAYLISERGVTALLGAQIEALAPLLDGSRDLSAVVRDMPAGATPGQMNDLLVRLTLAGLVRPWQPAPAGTDEQALAYWDAGGLYPMTAVANIANARTALVTIGDVDSTTTAATTAALETAGLTLAAGGGGEADLSVVLCGDYLAPELAAVDAAQRAAGRPWLLAKPAGATVWVGPVFQPPEHGCWHCLAFRLAAHRQAERYLQTVLGRTGPVPRPVVSLPSVRAAAAHVVALEAMKWLAGYRHAGQRSVWTFDSFDLRGRQHEVRARPQCAVCGDSTLVRAMAGRAVAPQPRRKSSCTGGGHRSMPPEQVLDRYRHLVSPVSGVIKEITQDGRGPRFFNAFRSGPNLAAGARSLRSLKSALRVENGGKGTTALHAEVGALCEALERHSGNFQGDEERVRGSLRSLGEQTIHPNGWQLFDEQQYVGRAAWNASHSPFNHVPAPFDERAVLDWTPAWSLTQRRHRLLPTSLLYFGAPTQPGPFFGCADSNGNAAGSSLEDAVLQGLLELVERDAVALWWYNRSAAPGVDIDAFADSWIVELREVYAALGREVWVLDVTSDLRVPTMVALSRWTDSPHEGIMLGFGSHLDPVMALRRALTELNQLMPAVAQPAADGRYCCDDDPDAAYWLRHATVANQPYLAADPAVRPLRPADFEYQYRSDLTEDVRVIQTRLEGFGLDLLVLDQTRPDIGLPVVKVIVPGMRHFRARFAPGRLFDVPVRLGRLPRPTPYERLNPIPLFL
jgi:bacteriocin biosynthesis cyclodehydratase domain-containing protein